MPASSPGALGLTGPIAGAQSPPKVLRVVPGADVAELAPTRAANQIDRIYSQMVFDTLFALDHTLTPRPMMVDTWETSADGLTWRFILRDGLRFHDGSAVTARDVVASLRRFMGVGLVGGQLRARDAGVKVDLQMGDLQMSDWASVFKRVGTPHLAPSDAWKLVGSYSLGGTWFNPLTNVALDTSCGPTASAFMGMPCDPEGEKLRQAGFETFQRPLWEFIPYIPAGQFDIVNACRKTVSGVLDGYVINDWSIDKA